MGLFSREWAIGTFRSHHPFEDTRALVVTALSTQLTVDELIARFPGMLDSIYFSELSYPRTVLTAGNSTRTLWNFTVELTQDGADVLGRGWVDRREFEKWAGNINGALHSMRRLLDSASIDTRRWKF